MSEQEERSRRAHLSGALHSLHPRRITGRLVRRSVKSPGTAPGTIVHTGGKHVDTARITLLDYDGEELRERSVERVEACFPFRDSPTVSWVNVDGLHDVDVIESLGDHFGLHPLVLEDIAGVGQRSKMEDYDDYLYLVLHMLSFDPARRQVESEQVSLVVGDRWVLSFQERVGDVFEPVRERLRSAKGRIRSRGADYLAYALVDAVVDGYYAVLEEVGTVIEEIDLAVMEEPHEDTLHRIHELKREMLVVRRTVWPVRDLMASLLRSEHRVIQDETKLFLRDVYDHAVQMLDTVETLRDLAAGLTDLYLSSVGQRTNEIVKVLTIIGSVFIPLTFVAGVYGMNFEHMPELAVPWAYPAVLGGMAVLGIGMFLYFRRRGWI